MTRWWRCVFAISFVSTGCGGNTEDTDAGSGADAGGECPAEVVVDADITSDTAWDCPTYVLSRRIFVENGATLTIAAGTTVLGEVGGSETTALLVTRGAHL